MPTSKAQQRATNKYIKNNYDRVNLLLTKGLKAKISKYAEENGGTMNLFIERAIKEKFAREECAMNEEQQQSDS